MSDLSLAEAALAYASTGWFVLPVMPGTKSPGSVVGGEWQCKSSRDPEEIAAWWSKNPDYGIALHAGRSGAIVFDLDVDDFGDLPGEMREGLRKGRFQSTRQGVGDRGHYVFAVSAGESYGNGAGAFRTFGEVRGKNGVIIAAPTPHVDADTKGGRYVWADSGPLPLVSEAPQLLACLRAAPENEAPLLAPDEMKAFLDTYTGSERMPAFAGLIKTFERELKENGSRHGAMVNALAMGFREAVAGCYPADDVYTTVQRMFKRSFEDKELSVREGRTRPSRDEFVRGAQWAAAQALLVDPEETLTRLNRDESALEERVEAFWTARPELSAVRQFAQARLIAPWALFGAVLVRSLAVVPPRVVLPPLIGSHGSVNSFVALVGSSGAGKSVTRSAARELVRLKLPGDAQLHVRNVGSGEGLVDQFATYDAKAKEYVGLRTRVMFTVDEVESLTAQGGRSGSTLFPTLRSAWTGDSLGFANRDKTKAIPVEAHRYRLTMIVGAQPTKAQPLLDDADGGTPQRFLWMPTTDPNAPDVEPAEPKPITVGPWPQPKTGFSVSGVETAEVALVTTPPDPKSFVVLAIPESVREDVLAQRKKVLRGDPSANPLDGHALMTRLKVAVGLMVLNGRYDKVGDDDWDLAGVVMEVSNRTRCEVERVIASEAAKSNQARGEAEGRRELAKAEVLQKDGLARVCDRIMKKLKDVSELKRSDMPDFLGRDKGLKDDAAELLAARGEVEIVRYKAKNGSPTWLIRPVEEE
ncbi:MULTISPECIES: bifunctional DNA primase/polymerase [Rhodococcus]|uniref:bifunctional DNA primase/polymerase n=1 Tax=Rhodococcus TaxID=1827 RepID=UPI001E62168A|nr:bifunctional DNA primase/polymerase [Rhodococcus pyridinivorans]MCD2119112.1 bifunctional DNA primase/polymerase [Rhodococcus pyridinivorans]MCZ4627997.1 bifunctional DNA primase/polymerase [Rhodococcus pyridinivorans]MCZ4649251.1 bifunctional DNA primase/polymerase [Rhodococcus pyridinivorans]MDJ0483439.1 bifunctional DNA primase/polymerase [Rhodococcus pyridinivorans]MDV7255312.1 bifunctional DNA primase/polymerase [Rhodococcus pyridinivorans]